LKTILPRRGATAAQIYFSIRHSSFLISPTAGQLGFSVARAAVDRSFAKTK
jgi:hypothetical protein